MVFPKTPDNTPDDGVAEVAELISDINVAMLTTADTTGRAFSRPMAVLEVEFDGNAKVTGQPLEPENETVTLS